MATRLIGTDSDDPWLPDVVKAHAVQAKIDDVAGNFTAVDVEGALAELSDTIDDVVITGGSMPAASDAETVAGVITNKAVVPAGLTEALPYPDARQFGAVIDGVTNDLAALNAYIADCAADKRPCYLRAGTYQISGGFLIGKGRIIGAGRGVTVIRQASANQPVIDVDSQSDWEVSDLTVQSNASPTNHRSLQIRGQGSGGAIHRVGVVNGGVYVTGGAKSYNAAGTTPGLQTRLVIDSVWVSASKEYGVCLESVQGCDLIAPQVTGAAVDGVKMLDNCDDVTVTGGFATLCGQEGMDAFMGGRNLTITGFKAFSNSGNGITLKSDDNLYQPGNIQLNGQTTVVGVVCRHNGDAGISIDRNGSVDDPLIPLMMHVALFGGVFEANAGFGIKVRARNVSLVAPLVRRNGQHGIEFDPAAMDCEAVSPQVQANGQQTVNTFDGIHIAGVRNRVTGGFSIGKDSDAVKADGDYAALTAQQRYGAVIVSGSTDCQIDNLTAHSNATGQVVTSDPDGLIRTRTQFDLFDSGLTTKRSVVVDAQGRLYAGAVGTGALSLANTWAQKQTLSAEIQIGGPLNHDGTTIGFYNATPIVQPTVTGAKGSNAALGSLITALKNMGLILDTTTA